MALSRIFQSLGPRPGGRVVSVRSRGGGGGGGGISSSLLQQLMGQQNLANQQFNAESRKMWKQLNRQINRARRRSRRADRKALREAEKIGEGQKETARMDAQRAMGDVGQSLVDTGLGNTTIRQDQMRGVESDLNRNLRAIDEQIAGRRTGILQARADRELMSGQMGGDFFLSRQRQAPDNSAFMQLLAQMGG